MDDARAWALCPALADALTKASSAGQWDVVARLAGELEARVKTRASSSISAHGGFGGSQERTREGLAA
jgi:hypothetical protein